MADVPPVFDVDTELDRLVLIYGEGQRAMLRGILMLILSRVPTGELPADFVLDNLVHTMLQRFSGPMS